MAQDELLDSHISLKQCKRAVEALHSHETKRQEKLEETELLSGKEPYIWLNVTVKSVSPTQRFKPCRISVAHPLVDPRTSPVCLITKDPQREYKDLLETNGIKFISRVVGVEKLKGKFKAYEARRVLLKEYDLFLADERVVPLLPKLLGTKFFAAKKQPIPVCLTRKGVKSELERAVSSTYMSQNQGTCTSVKVARLSHTPAQVLDNIKSAIPSIVKNIKGGWENIQSFQLKTNSSVSLPLWNCALDDTEEGRWHGLTAVSDEENSGESGSEAETATKVDSVKPAPAKKSKKRSSGEEEDEAEKPRKKAKGEETTSDAAPASSASTKSKPTSSKGKKSIANEVSDEVAGKKAKPAPVSSKDNKKRKEKMDDSNDSPSVPVAVASPLSKSKDKSNKDGKVGAKAVETRKTAVRAVDTSVTKDELKQKRSAVVGEKKKEKVVKSKGGKSAKQGLLGKKVAQV